MPSSVWLYTWPTLPLPPSCFMSFVSATGAHALGGWRPQGVCHLCCVPFKPQSDFHGILNKGESEMLIVLIKFFFLKFLMAGELAQ